VQFLARLLMALHDDWDILDDLLKSITSPDQWVADDHAAARP
jgi:hypothetical protein